MSKTIQSKPVQPGKMAVFTGDAAPTLEETGMMDAMTYTVDGADSAPASDSQMERMQDGAHLTVPFRQEGQGGFSLVTVDFAPGYLLPKHSHSSDCLYYILEGEFTVWWGKDASKLDNFYTLKKGDCAYYPTGWKYKVGNTGDSPGKFLYYMTSPPGIQRRLDKGR